MKMRPGRFLLIAATAALLGAAVAGVARAEFTYSSFGAKAGSITPENGDACFAFGVHLELDKPRTNFLMLPGVLYWKSGSVSDLNANFDAYYHLSRWTAVVPFFGAGAGVHLLSFEDDSNLHLGTNLFAGVRVPAPGMDWFVEGRYTAAEVSQFGVLIGITRRN